MKINKIDKDCFDLSSEYSGYLWQSDKTTPKVYEGEKIDEDLLQSQNPFIVEGLLYNEAGKKSYSIKYADGELLIHEFCLTDVDFAQNKEKTFYTNRMKGLSIKFLDIWEAVKDELCLGMEVLQPKAQVFIGFVKTEETNVETTKL